MGMEEKQQIDRLYLEMQEKGLISTGSRWIEKAVEQNPAKLTVAVAHSKILIMDRIDRWLAAPGRSDQGSQRGAGN